MVKKTKLHANELPVEDGLDIPDFDFDFGEPKDDRSPVHKILAAAGQGAKDSFNDSSYVKRLLRASMPPVYGEIDDIATNTKDNVKKLYNTAAKEIKPSLAEFARATEKLVPEGSRSKNALKSIREWAEDYKTASMTSEDKTRIREKNIALEIADIFAQQAELQNSHQTEAKAESKIKESIDLFKHREIHSVLGEINGSMSRLVQYQDKITQAYQRKSLEIQFRNYFVGMENLEEAKKSNEFNKTTLLSIMKNTALPEFVKIKNSERFQEFARNKLIEGLFGGTQAFINKSFANLGNTIRQYTDVIKDGLFSGTMAAEGAEMMKDMSGKTMSENVAEAGAKGVVQYGAMRAGSKVREILGKNKKVNKMAGNARYALTNFPELATEYANNQNFEDGALKSFGKSVLRDIIGNQRPDSSLAADGLKEVGEPAKFTQFTNKSITEIIPGYLSRIFREIQILRTGDESIKLTGYDLYSNKFMDSGSLKKSLMERLIPESAKKSHKESGKDILALIDPENKFTEEEREALFNKLTKDKFDKKRASYERLTTSHTFKSDPQLAGSADKIAAAFEKYFTDGGKHSTKSDEFLEKRNEFSGRMGQVGRFMNNPASEIQKLINAGYYDQLREMGFIDDLGTKINMEDILNKHNQGSGVPESFVGNDTAQAMVKRTKRVNGINKNTSSVQMELPQGLAESLLENSKTLKDFVNANKENQLKFESFIESQNNNAGNFNNAFKDGAMKVDAVTTNDILLRIEDFLVNKLKFVGSGDNGNFVDPESKGYYKDTLWNNTKGIAGRLKNTLYDKMGKPLSEKLWKATKWSTNSGISGAKWGLEKLAQGSNSLANLLVSARDIFVDGDPKAKLTAAGIKAGEYYDSVTGKVIKSIDDLKKCKGDILDSSKNIVLSKADFAKTYVRNIKGSGIMKIGESLFGKAMAFGKASSNAFLNTGARVIGAARALKQGLFNMLDQPMDIYVRGIDTPMLLASIMRAGGYISETTGRAVMRPSEIDGPIKDLKGNFVLTLDQLKQGIEDIDGNKIKTPMMKIIGAGIGMVKSGIKAAVKMGRFAVDAVKGGLDKTGDFFKGMLDSLSVGLGGKKSTDVLEQIRNILDERLPKSKKRFGDKDGDGDRDGSYQDLAQNKKETEDDNSFTDPTVKPDRKNTFDRISDGIGSIKDKIAGLFGMGEDGDGVDVDIDGDGRGRRKGRRGRGGKALRKGGAVRTTGRVLGKVAGGALSTAGMVGKGLWNVGKFALPVLGAGAGMVGSVLGAAASGIGALATGIAGVLSAPVVLGAAAVGLAAYGGYKLYKHLSKTDLTPIVKLRMAQYGLTKDEADQIERVIKIENLLMPLVKYKDGQADFDIDEVLIPRLLEASNIDPENRDSTNVKQIRKWTRWFVERFKPVFLTHLTTIKNTDPNQTLNSADKMDPNLKLKMLPALRFSGGPWNMLVSPFSDLDNLPAGEKIVNFNADEAEKAFKEEIAAGGDKTKKMGGAETTMATAVAGAAAAAVGADGKPTANVPPPPPLTFKDKLLKGLKTAVAILNPFATLGALVVSTIGPAIAKRFGFGADALEATRFKTYGLIEMDRSKVVALRNLESEMSGKIAFNANGSATFTGSVSEILNKVSGDFGIGGPASPEANTWSVWYGTRFLPVYLNYMGLIKNITGTDSVSKAEKALKSSQKLEIAKKLIATPGVWAVTASPWKDYVLNTDPNSTKENIKYLEENSAKDKVNEQKSSTATKAGQAAGAAIAAKTSAAKGGSSSGPATVHEQGPDGTYDRLPGYSNMGTNAVMANEGYRDKYDIAAAKGRDQGNELKNTVPGSKRPRGNFSGFGGDIDTYIREASQMFGMDEKILRGFIKMEAGWTGKMSPTGAIGTGQFIQSTWDSLAKTEEGKKIGMTVIGDRFRTENDPRHDKRINTLATALLAKQNAEQLRKAGLEPTGEMLYMMHNIGPGVIAAVKSGQVNGATLKAMQQNGMQPGMTPVSFVDYQKERFQDHYALANSVAPNIGGSNTEGVPIGRNRPEAYGGAPAGSHTTVTGQAPTTNQQASSAGNSGSYMGSVENTKPNPGVVRNPTYTQDQLPKENSPFSMGPKNPMAGFNLNGGARPQQNNLSDANKSIVNVDKTLVDSLTVQRQMLAKLEEISGKMNLSDLINALKGSTQPKAEEPKAPQSEQPPYNSARLNQNQTRPIPKAAVSMSRSVSRA